MNQIIEQIVQSLKDSGLGELIGILIFMAVMALGWKFLNWINRL